MSARNRVCDDFNIEQPAKRQKTEHNGGVVVNPFELLEFVEAIVAHLLIISPLSILNITCCSKRLRDAIRAKALWLRRGFKQLHDSVTDLLLPDEYLRAVLAQIHLDHLKKEELHWGEELYYLSEERYGGFTEGYDILACKFDLGSTTMNNYTNGLLALEYLADRCITEEAHRVLLNVMARQVNKLFSIQQLIQFIECSQQDILQKRKQNLFEYIDVSTSFSFLLGADFYEKMVAKARYYPNAEMDPGNFYLLLDIRPSEVYNTIANRTEILSSSLKFQIWKRFIDENRSVLILYGDSVIADHTIYALPAYIKYNAKENIIEECGFLDARELKPKQGMTDSEFFMKLIELPSIGKDGQRALLRVLFDRSRDMTVDRKMPPMKFFKNIKFKRTDTDRVTNAQQQQDIWFERVLPYLVTYPKSFMTFAGICKSFRYKLKDNEFWKRIGFVHFAEWYGEYKTGPLPFKYILKYIRKEFVHEKLQHLNAKIGSVQKLEKLPEHVIQSIERKLLVAETELNTSMHSLKCEEYLANTKLTDEAVAALMFLKKNCNVDISVEDLISFIAEGKKDRVEFKESLRAEEKELLLSDNFLYKVLYGKSSWADWDYYTLFMVENTFTTRLTGSNDDECATVFSVHKLWNGENRFVIFIPQFSIFGSVVVHEEQLYIKFDKSKNLIEECGTLSTFRELNCPNEGNYYTVLRLMFERPEVSNKFFNNMWQGEMEWQVPFPRHHFKNIKFFK